MRKLVIASILIIVSLTYFSCNKNKDKSDRYKFLTGNVWVSDSLLANGIDASGVGGVLEKFVGEAEFREDGTGYFGQYTGTWYFTNKEQNITITSDELILPLTCQIVELSSTDFKIRTSFNDPTLGILNIRITFKAK